MTKEQFNREKRYGAAISVAKNMLSKGLITEEEYHKIDTIFVGKYRPVFGSLQVGFTLTSTGFRGNM